MKRLLVVLAVLVVVLPLGVRFGTEYYVRYGGEDFAASISDDQTRTFTSFEELSDWMDENRERYILGDCKERRNAEGKAVWIVNYNEKG